MKNKKVLSMKTFKTLTIAVIFTLTTCWQFSQIKTARATDDDAELLFTPATTTVAAGADFNLVASVDPNSNDGSEGNPGINAVELHITFDETVLQINTNGITVNTTAFSSLEGYPTFDNVAGTATVVVYTSTPEIIPTDVATISFHAVSAATSSPVVFTTASNAAVNDGNGTQVVSTRTPAAVTITGTDGVAPTVTAFVIPANSASLTVPITTFTATDAIGVTAYLLTESSSAPASDDADWGAVPTEFVFGTTGTKTLYAWAKDAADNVSTSRNDSVTIDMAAPTGGSFTINSDAARTASTAVTLNVTCPTDSWTPVEMAFGNSANPTNWTTCAATTAHTLSAGDGTKTVYMSFRDGGQTVTASDVTDTIELDTTAPTGGSFTIDNGATEAVTTAVTLNITCPTDDWATVQMAFGNTASPTNWATCATTASHTLTSGNGSKTVYMRFRDGGLTVTSDTTDTITLNIPDTTPPVLSNGTPSGTLTKGTTSATVGVTTNENATCKYSTTAETAYASMTDEFTTTTGTTTHSFSATGLIDGGSYTYYVRCADEALNPTVSDYAISFSISNATAISDNHKSKSSSSKKKEQTRKITNSRKNVPRGGLLIERGNKFTKNSMVALYFSKYGGGYYKPMLVKTSKTGYFRVDYYAAKPKGTYNWYAVNLKTGWKSKKIYYRIKN
ncbi:MAG: hypothetical protein WC848_05960 [Parcubacteria group bacterium]